MPVLILFLLGTLAALACYADWLARRAGQRHCRNTPEALPHCPCALVLGTAPTLPDGSPNRYFTRRMDAAAELFRHGKVQQIIVSGSKRLADNYDEPAAMSAALQERGIPAHAITQDGEGHRTIHSVKRLKQVFGQSEAVIVSQRFHNERAIVLARAFGIRAHGYDTRPLTHDSGLRQPWREYAARLRMLFDLCFSTR